MKRTLCISDIHGCHDEFCELLQKVKYNPSEDKLILLGDYMDRGSKSKEVIELVMGLVNEHGAIALKGNHDKMFLDFVDGEDYTVFISNGGLKTLVSYYPELKDYMDIELARQHILNNYPSHIEFIKNLPYYYEDEENIYVHAGLNPMYKEWKDNTPNDMIWIRELFFDNYTRTDKTVIFGHTPCLNLHGKEDVWMGGDKIGIDGACAYGFQLNCLEISDEGYRTYSVDSKTRHKG
jgi:serine/threonine protein phosphatase 1